MEAISPAVTRNDAAAGEKEPGIVHAQPDHTGKIRSAIEEQQTSTADTSSGKGASIWRTTFLPPTSTSSDPGPPPDGGLQAWSQVLVGAFVMFSTWGYVNSYGYFQAYYISTFHSTPSAASWVISLQLFIMMTMASISGRFFDAGYFRLCLLGGFAFQITGMISAGSVTHLWQAYLCQGVCCGIGGGLSWCPTISLVSTYFVKRRTLALSAMLCGGNIGGIVFPLIARQLGPQIGFPWTARIMGLIVLGLSAVALALARTRVPPRRSGPLFEKAAWKEKPYVLFAVGCFLICWAVYFVWFYINSFAKDALHAPYQTTLTILNVLNAVSIAGRMLAAVLSDLFIGPITTFILVSLCSGILMLSWTAVESIAGLLVFASLYGAFGSAVQSLFSSALSSLTTDLSKMGTRVGMVFCVAGLAAGTGAPIAGALVERCGGAYWGMQVWGGLCLCVGAGWVAAARGVKLKNKGERWTGRI